MGILEKKVHKSKERNKDLESRLETYWKINFKFSCEKCESVFRNNSQLDEHTTISHVNKEVLLKKNISPPQLLMTKYFNVKTAISNLLKNMVYKFIKQRSILHFLTIQLEWALFRIEDNSPQDAPRLPQDSPKVSRHSL
jgi:hypothetical protein